MTSPGRRDPAEGGSVYLVERYLPPSAAKGLALCVARTARLCAASGASASAVQYLHSTYLPSEDTCFCVFRAGTADAVRAVNARAEFALDRITDAVALLLPTNAPIAQTGRTRST